MCSETAYSLVRLPWNDRAPGLARRFLVEASCPAHNARVLDEAQLLVSELVTNAVQHGTPPVTLRVHCEGPGGLFISVTDEDPLNPVERDVGPQEQSGRGVRLVHLVSDEWGVDRHQDDGKEVWFTLNTQAAQMRTP